LTEQILFTLKDVENIIKWFGERYERHSGNISKNEVETYLKLQHYHIEDFRSLS